MRRRRRISPSSLDSAHTRGGATYYLLPIYFYFYFFIFSYSPRRAHTRIQLAQLFFSAPKYYIRLAHTRTNSRTNARTRTPVNPHGGRYSRARPEVPSSTPRRTIADLTPPHRSTHSPRTFSQSNNHITPRYVATTAAPPRFSLIRRRRRRRIRHRVP